MSSGSESKGFEEFKAEEFSDPQPAGRGSSVGMIGAAMAPEKVAPERVDLRGKSTIFAWVLSLRGFVSSLVGC